MRIESRLCHISENKAVIKVTGWINNKNIGSALAEANSVELAEDKAISRLNNRINVFKQWHILQKSSGILFILGGILISFKDTHLLNTPLLIVLILLGILKFLRLEHPSNKSLGNLVTFFGKFNCKYR